MRMAVFQSEAYDIVENRRQEQRWSRQSTDQHSLIDPVVQLDLGFASKSSYALGEPNCVAGLDSPVIPSSCQKCRWRACFDEVDRLRGGEASFWPEADHTAIDARIEIYVVNPFPVERQRGGDMGAGRMPDDHDPAPITTEFRNILHRPAKRRRRIFDEVRKSDLRENPIVGTDGCKAPGRQS